MSVDTDAPVGRIVDDDIRLVRERADIEAIISEHVTLRNAGVGDLKGLCPFHDEKTPSFHVRPQVGAYHCFGCGEGGDAISFVQRIDGIPFADAVQMLADRSGITLRFEAPAGGGQRRSDPHRRGRLLAVNDATHAFYRDQLMSREAVTARWFLHKRGFDRGSADQFELGYAPQGWTNLHEHLTNAGFTTAEQVAAGVMTEGDHGVYDRFRGRLIWPIRDVTGHTIGFGARRLYDETDKGPKYLNTPDTELYRKSTVLYGIESAKKAIVAQRRVVVVEGYTDVMAARLAGVDTAVATCGTAFGPDHVRLVRRLLGDTTGQPRPGVGAAEIIYTFDGDSAGQKAAVRAFGEDQRFAASTSVAVAPDGQDPCELRQSAGDAAVRDLIENRKPLYEFVLDTVLAAYNLATPDGRAHALRAGAPVVASIRDDAVRDGYERALAERLRLDPVTVRRTVATASPMSVDDARLTRRRPQDEPEQETRAFPVPDKHDPTVRMEARALAAVLQHPALAAEAGFDDLDASVFTTPAYAAIHAAITQVGGVAAAAPGSSAPGQVQVDDADAAAGWFRSVLDRADPEVVSALTELSMVNVPVEDPEALPKYVQSVLAALSRATSLREAPVEVAVSEGESAVDLLAKYQSQVLKAAAFDLTGDRDEVPVTPVVPLHPF